MIRVEGYIRTHAPGSLYGEWAKKEDCWNAVRQQDFGISFDSIRDDLEVRGQGYKRIRVTEDEMVSAEIKALQERLQSVHPKTWEKIEEWGRATGKLTPYQRTMARTIGANFSRNRKLSEIEFNNGHQILDYAIEEASEIFFDMEEYFETDASVVATIKPEITVDIIQAVVKWDKKNKKLRDFEYRFMADIAEGKKGLTERNTAIALKNYEKVIRLGFRLGE
jgi:hypothetical protein